MIVTSIPQALHQLLPAHLMALLPHSLMALLPSAVVQRFGRLENKLGCALGVCVGLAQDLSLLGKETSSCLEIIG